MIHWISFLGNLHNRGSLRSTDSGNGLCHPFVGSVDPSLVLEWAKRYLDVGIDSLTLADTVGTATLIDIWPV